MHSHTHNNIYVPICANISTFLHFTCACATTQLKIVEQLQKSHLLSTTSPYRHNTTLQAHNHLIWNIVPMPRNDIEGRKILLRFKELAVEFVHDGKIDVHRVIKPRDWKFKVPRIGQSVGSNWAEIRQLEVTPIWFAHVASGAAIWQVDSESDTHLDDRNFSGYHLHATEFGRDP